MTENRKDKHFREIEKLREKIFESVLNITAIIGFPVLIASIVKLSESGYWNFLPVYILFYVAIIITALLKNRLSFRTRNFIMLVFAVLISVALLFRFGLSGAGGWFFISLSVFTTALMGIRWGLAVTACGAISFAIAGSLIVNGVVPFDFHVVTNNASGLSWFLATALFMAIGVVVILPQGILQNRLLSFLKILQDRSDELQDSNELLQAEINNRRIAEKKANDLQEQLIQSQKMEAVGRLAGGIAHDFNNLLTGILGHISIAKMDLLRDDPLYEVFDELEMASERASNLTKQLLAFSRKQISKPIVLDLNQNLRSMKNMLKRIVSEDIMLKMGLCSENAIVLADISQMEQVVVNLVVNARDAMPDGGTIEIKTRITEFEEEKNCLYGSLDAGKYVSLIVSDSGVGISSELMKKICEPFFTTKEVGKGTGLGLSTVYGIVGQHGGAIDIASEKGKGSTFEIFIPFSKLDNLGTKEKKEESDITGGDETILIVEDDDTVREMNGKILKKLGYNVLSAKDGSNAIEIFSENIDKISLLLTDVIMPGMNGKELAENILNQNPQLEILFTSGYTGDVIGKHGVLDENINFISKPYDTRQLALKIRSILDRE